MKNKLKQYVLAQSEKHVSLGDVVDVKDGENIVQLKIASVDEKLYFTSNGMPFATVEYILEDGGELLFSDSNFVINTRKVDNMYSGIGLKI